MQLYRMSNQQTETHITNGVSNGVHNHWPRNMYSVETRILGVPYSFGQGKRGVEKGPKAMRDHGTIKLISEMGFKVKDTGDIEFDDVEDDTPVHNVRRPRAIGKANKQIADHVVDSIQNNSPCLVLGGDHSLAIGSIYGHVQAQKDVGIIWVDAHADLNPPQASYSGNTHGMPLAFLIKEIEHLIPKDIPEFDWIKPCISAKDIAYIGLRDLDPAEKDIIEQYGITAFTMNDVVELGIPTVVKQAIAAVSHNNTRPIHLSFDIDGLDPTAAPSTGTPVPGGLTLREGVYIVEKVAATGRLAVMDLVEVNPDLGSAEDREITLQSASEIICAWFGRRNRMQMAPGYAIPKP